jgi:hypothetical protein
MSRTLAADERGCGWTGGEMRCRIA